MISKRQEGEAQQQQSRMVGLCISKVLNLIVDRDRQSLGHPRNASADHQHHPKLTHCVGKASTAAVSRKGRTNGSKTRARILPGRWQIEVRRFQNLAIDRAEARGHRLHGKGQAEDDGADHKSGETRKPADARRSR